MTTSAEVPGRLPVAVNGHAYMANPQIVRQTVPVIRQQADTSTEAGEQSLNPAGLWRRSQESWHHGAGQDFLDGRQGDEATDPHRFRSSKGVDVWTRGQASLLHPTLKAYTSANSNLYLAVAQEPGGVFMLYVADGTELYWSGLPYNGLNASQTGTGWTPTNATITGGAAGTENWFQLTATGAGAVSVTSPTGTAGVPVDAGREYGFVVWTRYNSGGSPRVAQISVNWYNAAGTLLSSTTPVNAPGTDGAPLVTALDHQVAPAGAAFASVTVGWTTNWAAGEKHEVRSVTFGPYDDTSAFGAPDAWTGSSIQAGEAAQTIQSITTDGSYVWAALGVSGLHRTRGGADHTSTANVPAAPASGQVSLVGYANGFLLAAGSAGTDSTRQNSLWLVTDPLGTPALSLIKTHPNTTFVWTGIGPGRNCVYAWGNSGGNGEVYKILFDPNTGSLSTAASFATYLPDGETIHALQFYAGGIIMGTGRGVRIGQADGSGNIDYGPLVPTLWPVRCLEPQDRYCWFGWTKYDATNSGLGRIDLGYETERSVPAWASDLMTSDTSTGDTVATVTFAPYGYTANQRPPVRVFSVAGKGVYIEDPGSRVASGNLKTGTIRFSTSEPKTTRSMDLRHHALPAGASVAVEMQRDSSNSWAGVGSSTVTGSYGPAVPLDLQNLAAEAMEFAFTIYRPTPSGTDFTRSPELTRWTAKVLPTPTTVDETFEIPLIMRARTATGQGDGTPWDIDVATEIAYLKGLERTRAMIDVQIGSETITNCYVAASKFDPDVWNDDRTQLEGIFTVQISTARG